MAAQTWSYGITTVPERRSTLLPRTLASLKRGGFDAPRLFVDGVSNAEAVSWEEDFGLAVTARNPRIRTFGNWMLGMAELYIRDPQATRFAIFQDDLICVRNLRQYLDRVPIPGGAYLNLYSWPRNAAGVKGSKDGFYPAVERGKGALALVFTRDAVRDLLTQQHTVDRPMDSIRGHRQVDGGIWNAMHKSGHTEMIHKPSLVQHLGLKSTMTVPGDNHDNQSLAPDFRGEDYDALQMLPAPIPSTPAQRAAWEAEKTALETAVFEDVKRMQGAKSPSERAKFKGHIDRYKLDLIRHETCRPE